MMLLREFLREDGAIFVSIDDTEGHRLRLLMDEVFGAPNFLCSIVWEKSYTANQTAMHISNNHDFIVGYARSIGQYKMGKFGRSPEQVAKFKNPDNDLRGSWKAENLSAGKFYSAGQFKIVGPTGREFFPPPGRYWRCNEEQYQTWLADGRITFGKNGTGRPMLKKYLKEMERGLTPSTWWKHEEFGTNKDASIELKRIFGGEAVFQTPKPVRLLYRLLQITTKPGDLVIDSFAGSGTTGHAVMQLNAEDPDDAPRRFVLCEMEPEIAQGITAERLRRVGAGYADKFGLDGGFRFCTLGSTLFDADGRIRDEVGFAELARHVYFTETGQPLPADAALDTPLLGVANGTAVYLLYNGILKDRSAAGGNALTREVLQSLPPHDGPKVVYGTSRRVSEDTLRRLSITFRQTPYQIRTR